MLDKLVNWFIATVWLVNGLFCKVFNLVPRHREIVARILGENHAALFTTLIGIGEMLMAVWIFTGLYRRLNALVQILLIAVMNTFEFFLVPDLLLWGRLNAVFAFLFILVVYYNGFYSHKR